MYTLMVVIENLGSGLPLISDLLGMFPNLFIYLFVCLFIAALGLCCCAQAFSTCGERGLLFVAKLGLLIVVAFSCCRARGLGTRASVVVARGL